MLTIIYPYRNREVNRVKKSLDSLASQNNKEFKVVFVDYGTPKEQAKEIEELVTSFPFANYQYYSTQHQPWNKSRALNSVIKNLKGSFCFIADIDMIFHSTFVETALLLQKEDEAVYFKVGFLDEKETQATRSFSEYKISFESDEEATGLTLFPVKKLKEINGFDEFYHFWGAEDTDVHARLRNNGTTVTFYDKDILLLHQWHPSYRSKESKSLSQSLQLTGIVQLNHQHLKFAKQHKVTIVNPKQWGEVPSAKTFAKLEAGSPNKIKISNQKEVIDHFLFVELPTLSHGLHTFFISEDNFQKTIKYTAKKRLGKKVPNYYTLKEINDALLLQIITFYRNYPYIYKINKSLDTITFTILKAQ
jgi:glycosyltransferase involved in cell wall biosynthesis